MFNSFGNILRLTTFGESHGKAIGGVIDGFPSGVTIPGQSRITTSRSEDDKVEILSGIFEGKSTGSPIGFLVWNKNQHSSDYSEMQSTYRPSHADYTYKLKYGIRDYRGGGRSSARETIARVVGGALAKIALRQLGISIRACANWASASGPTPRRSAPSAWKRTTRPTTWTSSKPTPCAARIRRKPRKWRTIYIR